MSRGRFFKFKNAFSRSDRLLKEMFSLTFSSLKYTYSFAISVATLVSTLRPSPMLSLAWPSFFSICKIARSFKTALGELCSDCTGCIELIFDDRCFYVYTIFDRVSSVLFAT